MVLNGMLRRNRSFCLSVWWSFLAYNVVLRMSGPAMSTASQLHIQLEKSRVVSESFVLDLIEIGNETRLNQSDLLTSIAVIQPSAEIRAATLFGEDENSKISSTQSARRQRRDVFHGLLNMMKCTTQCEPLSYKGYGCYCGFLGSGPTVDAIDMCCKKHDYCYGDETSCKHQSLVYFVPYKWKCNGGHPYCGNTVIISKS